MRERVGMLGGTVKVTSGKGKGTRIEVTVPTAACIEVPYGTRPSLAAMGAAQSESA
jgi:signal transduction histidine kinase